jgi:hypothetical protein
MKFNAFETKFVKKLYFETPFRSSLFPLDGHLLRGPSVRSRTAIYKVTPKPGFLFNQYF